MSISAEKLAANIANAQHSTGPTSEAGKETSSKNATIYGLFSLKEFILEGDEGAYKELVLALQQELSPVGILEEGLVDEIRRAMWRLRRCANVEFELAATARVSDPGVDPMQQPGSEEEKIQKSVDRARAQANRIRKQAMAELRQLQTERRIRKEIFVPGANLSTLGLVDNHKVRKAATAEKRDAILQDKLDQTTDFVKFEQMFGPPKKAA